MNVRAGWIAKAAVVIATTAGVVGICLAAETNPPTTQPAAASPAKADGFPYIAHVTGDNVNIRSGPDANYYPVRKAKANEEVTVYGQQYDWLCIAPPKACYSLIDRQYVDKTADGVGVVNGDNVWVRVGSDLDAHRYAKQVMLRKGTEVQILGETSDNAFFKIAPPEGARLWIHGQFVSKGPGSAVSHSPTPREPLSEIVTPVKPAPKTPRPAVAKAPTTQPAATGSSVFGTYAEEIAAIDEAIKAEQKKPAEQQNMKPFVDRLRPIAQQDDEQVAKLYAQRRMEQLQTKGELTGLIQSLEAAKAAVDKEHEVGEMARKAIKPPPETIIDGRVKASGEFRPSAIFGGNSQAYPRRYRLVDPATEKTVAYVELPAGTQTDPDQYFGKMVTVYARERKLTSGAVQPLSVLMADEIKMEAKGFAPGLIELPKTDSSSASGQPAAAPNAGEPAARPAPTADTPTTQPAADQQ